MLLFPNAKLNLGLHVLRKRNDGYHDLATVMVPVPGLKDALEFVPSGADNFELSGMEVPGEPSSNICLKALALMRQRVEVPPLSIYLHKAIPMGAGLGGGSADGAFMLKALASAYAPELDQAELHGMAAALGSDCAFFLANEAAHASGRGEVLEPVQLALEGWYAMVIHAGIHISTAEAYGAISPLAQRPDLRKLLSTYGPEAWKGRLENDFEAHAFTRYPLVKDLVDSLYATGAAYAAMTGSGSAVYGLYGKNPGGLKHPLWEGHFVHVSAL